MYNKTLKHNYFVYILANRRNGTIYVGVTNDLERRIYEHKNNIIKGFTQKYNIHKLVYCEYFDNINNAITREKNIKKWKRQWKTELIEKENSTWRDLSLDWRLECPAKLSWIPAFAGMTKERAGNDKRESRK